MSIKVQSYVWENSKADGSALLLLLAIADHAHDDGTGAWPSVAALARKCRQGERNTRYLLRKLEEMGELRTDIGGGPHGCNSFSIPLEGGQSLPPANQRTEGGKPAYVGGQLVAPEPSLTINKPSVVRNSEIPVEIMSTGTDEIVLDEMPDIPSIPRHEPLEEELFGCGDYGGLEKSVPRSLEQVKAGIARAAAQYQDNRHKKGVSNPRAAQQAEERTLAVQLARSYLRTNITWDQLPSGIAGACKKVAGSLLQDIHRGRLDAGIVHQELERLVGEGGQKYAGKDKANVFWVKRDLEEAVLRLQSIKAQQAEAQRERDDRAKRSKQLLEEDSKWLPVYPT